METSNLRYVVYYLIMICCFSVFAGCKKDKLPPSTIGSFSKAIQSHLIVVKNTVAAISDPTSGKPVSIPDFDFIYEAAANIESSNNPPKYLACIYSLLGRAADVDCEVPNPENSLTFPMDHHIHPKMGYEWYYLGIYLDATDSKGVKGRIGIVLSMQKQRVIGLTTQEKLDFSDNDCMLFINLVTATIDFPNRKKITRRSNNLQLPALGGSGSYSFEGENFSFTCGDDNLSGSVNVLPLTTNVNDGEKLSFSLSFISPHGMNNENAFFLQGIPDLTTLIGTGFTINPSPGIYYSWPQLKIDTSLSNTITVDGMAYTISGGGGWMDHQIMMQSLKNLDDAVHPVPFVEEVKPYNGWSWQYFNLDNGDAFTGASFQLGDLNPSITFSYGYYVNPNATSTEWESKYIFGDMYLKDFQSYPVMVNNLLSPQVQLPSLWEYENIQSVGILLSGKATPWFNDGTFNGQALQIISENPVDYIDTSGELNNGVGFCESIGFEQVDSYRSRVMAYLGAVSKKR